MVPVLLVEKTTMKILICLAIALCASAAAAEEMEKDKSKRQTQEELIPTHFYYRAPRKQEQSAPVEEPEQDVDDKASGSRSDADEYRPGQVFSLNARELLELQPERKAPVSNNELLQHLYSNSQQDSNQQFYYLEPQVGRQVSLQPSRAVIARPNYSSNGGEASVGAALSVSDSGASSTDSFDPELLALLGQAPVRQKEHRQQLYTQSSQVTQAPTVQSAAPQYQQVDRYVTKPSKKSTKLRSKVQITAPQIPTAPQQYLIETTNVQQQQQQQQQEYRQAQTQPQYRSSPQHNRLGQVLRYVPFQQAPPTQQPLYENPESQGLQVVPAPKFQQPQQPRAQLNYRLNPQYQPEANPNQYRILEAPRPQPAREEKRVQAQSAERPVAYLKRYPEPENLRSVKIYDPVVPEGLPQQGVQFNSEEYYFRPLYRTNDQRARYELQTKPEQRVADESKPPHSAIYVSKNLAPRKHKRPQPVSREQNVNIEQPEQEQRSNIAQQVNIEQHGQSLEEQLSRLPPPRNNKAYTPEEFAALVAAGFAVTPVPVSAHSLDAAQSRSAIEAVTPQPQRRPVPSRRHQYLPLRGDDAP